MCAAWTKENKCLVSISVSLYLCTTKALSPLSPQGRPGVGPELMQEVTVHLFEILVPLILYLDFMRICVCENNQLGLWKK